MSVNRAPKVQVAIRPELARAFRLVARLERRQLSDIFHDMFVGWLRRRKSYLAVLRELENDRETYGRDNDTEPDSGPHGELGEEREHLGAARQDDGGQAGRREETAG